MKKTGLLMIALLLGSFTQAQWGKKIKGNGKVVTIERTTASYDAISVSGWFDVALTDGKEGNISIKGEENLLEYIITEVKDDKLVVKIKNGVNLQSSSWKDGAISVTIPVEKISDLSMSGSGDLVSQKVLKATDFEVGISGSGDMSITVEATAIEVNLSGSGDMNLAGSAENLEIQISGSGDVNAYDLRADNVSAMVSGSATVKVTANETIKARVSGSGDIYYRGNPKKIDSKISGSGDITKG